MGSGWRCCCCSWGRRRRRRWRRFQLQGRRGIATMAATPLRPVFPDVHFLQRWERGSQLNVPTLGGARPRPLAPPSPLVPRPPPPGTPSPQRQPACKHLEPLPPFPPPTSPHPEPAPPEDRRPGGGTICQRWEGDGRHWRWWRSFAFTYVTGGELGPEALMNSKPQSILKR